MRAANQKTKLTCALKNMKQNDRQQSNQATDNQHKINTMSIVNIDSCGHQSKNKTENNRKNMMFSTLTGPHKKHQANGLKSLIETTIKLSQKQQITSKFKSQRTKSSFVKNLSNYSQRINNKSKLLRRSSDQTSQRLNQTQSKIEAIDHNELQNSKRKSKSIPSRGNEILIYQYSDLETQNSKKSDLVQITCQNRKSKTQSSVLLDNDSFYMVQNFAKWQKERTIVKFKESLKNKQSRKNIHRVLRQTSQTNTKNKSKTKHFSMSKDGVVSSNIYQIQNLTPLHFSLFKGKIKHFYSSNLKRFSFPLMDDKQGLKIQAKAAEIIDTLSKQTQEQAIKHIYKSRELCFQIKQYDLKGEDRTFMKKRWKTNKQKYTGNVRKQKESTNFFRELTPWHEDQVQ